MYKIQVRNNETGIIWWEYGFSKFMMKRIHFLFNETNPYDYTNTYDILQICKIIFTLKIFKKCLTNATKVCYN